MAGLALSLALGACATHAPTAAPPPLIHHGPVAQAVDVDVLAMTPEMRQFVDRYALRGVDPETRLNLLTTAIVDSSMLGFHYQGEYTLTAEETFVRRMGNCVGFSNMMVALARAAGLDARYQEITLQPEWFSREDTLLVAKHINVVVRWGVRSWTVDTSGIRARAGDRKRLISDREAQALYYNNRGVDALLAGDHHQAWAWFAKSAETAPDMADPWINLGVVYTRNGQLPEAELMYRNALAVDPGQYSALSNLYGIYERAGESELAGGLARQVERYRQRNPYYLLHLGEEALAESRYEDSRRLIAQAIEKKDDEHRFYFALARVEYLAGNTQDAEANLARARELAPPDVVADYDRPLAELVFEP